MNTKTYICYRSDKECYRIQAEDYQIHDNKHLLYFESQIVASFPVNDQWVIMPDEFISDETEAVRIISNYISWRFKNYVKGLTEEELIKMWWNENH